ncbi:peptide/nickel transport system substrate-binding protein [Parelusimicrobium proximum]|uniref:ABC transporter substrate-binding protein n=1 Tax=Parelusimicrobium proximum TaxID=3228953 RepID=UPI003D16DBA5
MKKILILITALFILACAKTDDKETIFFAHKGEMQSLDPVYPYDGVSQGLILNVYDTLIKFKGSSMSEYEPSIAVEVPSVENGGISEDGRVYTFKIRKDVKFHNGYELTPEDVRYSILRFMLSDRAGGPSNLLLEPILGVSSTRSRDGYSVTFKEAAEAVKTDGDNVVITLKRPFAPFLSIMARWSYVMSKKWASEIGEWDGAEATWQQFNNRDKNESKMFDRMNGTGPFKLIKWDIAAKRLQLASNEEYFLGAPKIKNIFMLSVNEPSTMRLMLESGDVDLAELSEKFASQMKDKAGIVIEDNLPRLKTDPVIFFTLDINTTANPDIGSGKLDGKGIPADFFKDKNLRKAFAHSFDYEAYLKESLEGRGEIAVGPIPPGLTGYDAKAKGYRFDLKKAEDYFKKAYGGEVWEKGFQFAVTYNTGGDVRQIAAEILKRNVESINPKFKIELRGVNWAAFLERTDGRKMPVWIRGWIADYADAHNFMFPFLHSKGRYALSQGYANAELDKLIERAVSETDESKRAALYAKVQAIAHEESVQLYTAHPTFLWARKETLKGFTDNPVFMGIYFYPLYKD